MKPFILLVVVACCWPSATAIAEDYLLRVDTVGYIDQPASEKNPKETVLRSIEVIARPNEPFRGKVKFGEQTLSMTGEFHPDGKGGFELRIKHVHLVVHPDKLVTGKNGCWEPVVDTTSADTGFSISLDKPQFLAGMETTRSNNGKPELQSKFHNIVLLTKYTPLSE